MLSQKWILLEGFEKLTGAEKMIDTHHRDTVVLCPILRSPDELSGAYGLGIFHAIPSNLRLALSIAVDTFLDAGQAVAEAAADELVRYFFQVNYLKQEGHPVLFFCGHHRGDRTVHLAHLIRQRALEQGFRDLVLLYEHPGRAVGEISAAGLPSEDIGYFSTPSLTADTIHFDYVTFVQNWLDYAVATGNINEPPVFLRCNDLAGAARLLDLLRRQEDHLAVTHLPFRIGLLLGRISIDLQNKKHLLDVLGFDNKNKSDYVTMQKTELLKTLQWYEDQYEVLPLWYKRFGHIIKVFMGKRSFKSLFK